MEKGNNWEDNSRLTRKKDFKWGLFIALMLFFIIPGLIYLFSYWTGAATRKTVRGVSKTTRAVNDKLKD